MIRRCVALSLVLACLGSASANKSVEGFTEPFRTVEISASEPGVIAQLSVQAGQTVQRGTPLLALETSVLEAELLIAQHRAASNANIEVAEAEVQFRAVRLAQTRQLHANQHASDLELARVEADLAIVKARLELAKEAQVLDQLDCRRIQAQINRRKFLSPYAGVVSQVHREVGESLSLTDPLIVTLVQLSRLRARFPTAPSQASRLHVGQRVSLVLPDTKESLHGLVDRIAPVIDAKSGTVDVEVVIDNAEGKWRSGARCLLQLPFTASDDVVSTRSKPTGLPRRSP